MPEDNVMPAAEEEPKKKNRGCVIALVAISAVVTLCSLSWMIVRPGVFTFQPIGALPEGVTFVYHSRNPEMPFISSPDGLCLDMQGSVTLLCRAAALGAAADILDRTIVKLPYQH